MATGLIALLDDIAALSKMAAASLDDVAANAAKAGSKAAGIVIDDTAVTPRYVVGLAAERELPIIWKIAVGSLRNKLLILLPAALALSAFAPKLIPPLLMIGGVFLCVEGYHKVADLFHPHDDSDDGAPAAATPEELEKERVSSAIRTDFILSAEIMAIALAAVATAPIWLEAVALVLVGVGMTIGVYGMVALIVKADDAGVALARSSSGAVRALGRALVGGMPIFLQVLSFVGMLAMLWVGGGILLHGLHELGVKGPEATVHHWAVAVGTAFGAAAPAITWLTQAFIAGALGVTIGALTDAVWKLLPWRARS